MHLIEEDKALNLSAIQRQVQALNSEILTLIASTQGAKTQFVE